MIISNKDSEKYLGLAKQISPDKKDIDYFALALMLNCPIWSHDKKLKEQNKILIYSTFDMINKLQEK